MLLSMSKEFLKLPTPSSTRLIPFDTAKVFPGFLPNTWILVVSGEKPYLNMIVQLRPRIYVRQPAYWEIEVTGYLPGFGLPATAPYTEALPLDGIIGTKGIDVIGSNKNMKIVVPPKAKKSTKAK